MLVALTVMTVLGLATYAQPKKLGHSVREVVVSNGVKISISYPQGEVDRIVRTPASDLIILKEGVALLESIIERTK